MTGPSTGTALRLLAVDDEPPALDELAYLLRADPRVQQVRTASDAVSALKALEQAPVDGVFLDLRMPGLSGLELAGVLGRFAVPPPVVFVTAHDDAAVEAFSLRAVDYLLKPVRAARLAEAVARVAQASRVEPAAADPADAGTIAVELGGVTHRLVKLQRELLAVEDHRGALGGAGRRREPGAGRPAGPAPGAAAGAGVRGGPAPAGVRHRQLAAGLISAAPAPGKAPLAGKGP